ncbi:MAG: gliding motility protein GldM [Bacteroidota bacterium]|jgi:gliding motility-associated protein GldM
MASNNPSSSRQKMINLMYLVFIAMLAINLPEEVLDGLDMVNQGLQQTISSNESQNKLIVDDLKNINAQNPVKAGQWFTKADHFIKESDKLFNYVQDLKIQIVKDTDGPDGDVDNIKKREDINAVPEIMLYSKDPQGEKLKNAIEAYRALAVSLVSSKDQQDIVVQRLSTEIPKKGKLNNRNWQETLFDQMPTSAAVTLLTQIQSDIRVAQGDVLSDLFNSIGGKDYKVNSLEAQVVPKSEYIMAGGVYEGKVVLTAVDTTKKPTFSIPGIRENGDFAIGVGAAGINKIFSGNLILSTPDGDKTYPFKSEYHVVPKMTTIQVADANVLYQGEPNKMTISVPGLSNDQLRATASNGSIFKTGDTWVATPTKAGTNMKISVYNTKTNTLISEQDFRVRLLPDPTPYFEFPDANANMKRFKSGGRIAKTTVLNVSEIRAAIDDGLLDRQFTVLRFSVVIYDGMGNRIPELSDSGKFTDKQKALVRQLGRGKTFLISDVKVRGKDGVERDISTLEVRLN